MGGNSTSQSALLRDESNTRPAYDLRSWQGLTDVLRAAKQHLTPEKHAAFRDLVLRYAQQGGDVALKSEIDAVIATLDTPQAALPRTENSSQPQTVSRASASASNRMGRPVPQFSVRKSVSQPVAAIKPAPVIPNTPPPAPTPPPVVESKPEPAPAPTPAPKAPVFEPPAPKPVETPRPEPVTPPPTPPAPPAPKEGFSGTPRSLDEHKARIIEIKRLVNEQIGNPVALVGAHKTLGREYMQALLTALKATGGGGVGADAAMRRLEDAYTALFTDIPKTPDAPPVPQPAPEPVIEPAPVVEVKEEVVPPPTPTPAPTPPPVVESKPEPAPAPTPAPKAPVFEPPAPKPVETPRPEPVTPPPTPPAPRVVIPKPEPRSTPKPEPVRPAPVVPPPPRRDAVPPKPPVPTPVPPAPKEKLQTPAALSPTARLAALTKDVPPAPKATPIPQKDVPTPKSEPTATAFQQTKYTQKKVGSISLQALAASGIDTDEHEVRQSELASPKITKALHELLDEWSIFNASGFLGMGPSGFEHPLYIRLAPLSMGEILTGRYEGADRKVNTVVHDYVNAWRHEQGIAYTPSETFEHYLRRVVQRIQKRQGTPA